MASNIFQIIGIVLPLAYFCFLLIRGVNALIDFVLDWMLYKAAKPYIKTTIEINEADWKAVEEDLGISLGNFYRQAKPLVGEKEAEKLYANYSKALLRALEQAKKEYVSKNKDQGLKHSFNADGVFLDNEE